MCARCQCRTLPHSPGQLVGIAFREIQQPAAPQLAQRPFAALRAAECARFKPEFHIVDDLSPGQEQVLLQHEAPDGWVGAGDRTLVEQNAPVVRPIETGDQI